MPTIDYKELTESLDDMSAGDFSISVKLNTVKDKLFEDNFYIIQSKLN